MELLLLLIYASRSYTVAPSYSSIILPTTFSSSAVVPYGGAVFGSHDHSAPPGVLGATNDNTTQSYLTVRPSKSQDPHGMQSTDKQSENRRTPNKRNQHAQAKNQNVTGQ